MRRGKYQKKTSRKPLGFLCVSAVLIATISCGVSFAINSRGSSEANIKTKTDLPKESVFVESEEVELSPTSAVIEIDSSELFMSQPESNSEAYPNMPNQFSCITVSGRSNWVINPKANGFFSGTFTSSDWGDQGPDYPNGTCYITEISGRFTAIEKINEYSYRMIAESIEKTAQAGETYISDNVRYVVEEGTGINNGDEFYLYLPGVSYAEFPRGLVDSVNNNGYHTMEEITQDSYVLYNPDPESSGYEFVFIGKIGIMPTNIPQSINQYDLRELTSFNLNGFWYSTDGQYVYQIFTSEYDSGLTNMLHYVDLNGSDDVKAGKVIQTSSYSINLKANEDRGAQFEVFAVDKQLMSDEITLVRTDDYTTGRILGTWKNEDWAYTFERDGTYSVDRARGDSYWGYYFIIDESRIVMSEHASESKLRNYRIDENGLWIDNINVLRR